MGAGEVSGMESIPKLVLEEAARDELLGPDPVRRLVILSQEVRQGDGAFFCVTRNVLSSTASNDALGVGWVWVARNPYTAPFVQTG
jgi:hypothetical protein